MAGGVLATGMAFDGAAQPHWKSETFLDSGALVAGSEHGRRVANDVSDYLAMGLVLYPFAIDSLLVAGAVHGSADVALQMSLIGMQSVLLTNLVTNLTKELVGRARPDAGSCEHGNELACSSPNESFVSGHTAGAFVGAGLICAQHQNFALYGDGAAGAVACGLALAGATAVGTLRIVAGRHHFTDVLAGAAIGLGAGYLLPNLTHYGFGGADEQGGATLMPMLGRGTVGAGMMLTF